MRGNADTHVLGRFLGAAQQLVGRRVVFERDQYATEPSFERTVVLSDERDRCLQTPEAGLFIPLHAMAPALVEIMVSRGESGRGV